MNTIPVLIGSEEKSIKESQDLISGHEKTLLLEQGYDFCRLSDNVNPEKGKFYIRKKNDFLECVFFDLTGKKKDEKISKDEFEKATKEKFDQVTSEPILDNLKPFLQKILNIISAKGHAVVKKSDAKKDDTDEYIQHLQNSFNTNKGKIDELDKNIDIKENGYRLVCLQTLPKYQELKDYYDTYILITDRDEIRKYFENSERTTESLIYFVNDKGISRGVNISCRETESNKIKKKYENFLNDLKLSSNKPKEIKSGSPESKIAWKLIRSDGLHMKTPGSKYLVYRLSEIDHERPAPYRTFPYQQSFTGWKWALGIGFLMRYEEIIDIKLSQSFIKYKTKLSSGVISNPEGEPGSSPIVDWTAGTFKAKYATKRGEDADCKIKFYIPSNEVEENVSEIEELKRHIGELEDEIKDLGEKRQKLVTYNKRLKSDISDGRDRVSNAKKGILEAEQEIKKSNGIIVNLREQQELIRKKLEELKEDFELFIQIVARIEFNPPIIQIFYVMYQTYLDSALENNQEQLEQKDHKYEHEQKATLELSEDHNILLFHYSN